MREALPALDMRSLEQRFGQLAPSYSTAHPFPHVVMDDFFPPELLHAVLAEFPAPEQMEIRFDGARQVKSASQDWARLGPATRQVIAELNSGPFISFLEHVTGIPHLIGDPHLEGGGLHHIGRGGKLGVHVDFNRHDRLRLHRRLNLLIYLNDHWQPSWGGAFEMWAPDMSRCEKRVEPLFNRCVVFSTTERSFHGHPDPLECPPEAARRSLAMYYYTADRPADGRWSPHSTLFRDRPERSGTDSTRRDRLRDLALEWLPPAVFRRLQRRGTP